MPPILKHARRRDGDVTAPELPRTLTTPGPTHLWRLPGSARTCCRVRRDGGQFLPGDRVVDEQHARLGVVEHLRQHDPPEHVARAVVDADVTRGEKAGQEEAGVTGSGPS